MKKTATLLLVLLVALGVAVFTYYKLKGNQSASPAQPQIAVTEPSTTPVFSHVVIIVEENKPQSVIIGSSEAPYFNQLANDYAIAANYSAVANPSLPNYIALTSGTTAGIANDCNPPSNTCKADEASIADRLEQAGKTWKMYAESMPGSCYMSNAGEYAVKHNPFLYYPAITSNSRRCAAHVVPFSELNADLRSADSLPNYAFVAPNLCHDTHNCSIRTGDDWLAQYVPAILSSPAFTQQKSLLVITWDEGETSDNTVPLLFAGSAAKTNFASSRPYNHYSLLRTIENNWNLPPFTENDKATPPMTELLK